MDMEQRNISSLNRSGIITSYDYEIILKFPYYCCQKIKLIERVTILFNSFLFFFFSFYTNVASVRLENKELSLYKLN